MLPFGNMFAGCITNPRNHRSFATYDRQASQGRKFKMRGANISATVTAKILTGQAHGLSLRDCRDVPSRVS
jgi:hypothetical protein